MESLKPTFNFNQMWSEEMVQKIRRASTRGSHEVGRVIYKPNETQQEELKKKLEKIEKNAFKEGYIKGKTKERSRLIKKTVAGVFIYTAILIMGSTAVFSIQKGKQVRYPKDYKLASEIYDAALENNDISVPDYTAEYDSETMDIHVFIYTFYIRARNSLGYTNELSEKMNTLIYILHLKGLLPSDNFSSYCSGLNPEFVHTKGDKDAIDLKAYESALEEYTTAIGAKEAAEEAVETAAIEIGVKH